LRPRRQLARVERAPHSAFGRVYGRACDRDSCPIPKALSAVCPLSPLPSPATAATVAAVSATAVTAVWTARSGGAVRRGGGLLLQRGAALWFSPSTHTPATAVTATAVTAAVRDRPQWRRCTAGRGTTRTARRSRRRRWWCAPPPSWPATERFATYPSLSRRALSSSTR
jgi:hypothetical protein